MKKAIFAIASFASMLSTAQAQSSVTLYGTVDTGIAYFGNQQGTPHSGGTFQMSPGNLSANRWGLKGSEDLGSGMSAIFKLESGFNIDNGKLGQGGRMFGRTAIVGLSDTHLGTVTLGRQYDPLIDLIQPLTNDGAFAEVFATPGDMDNYDNSFRTNNAVKYASPDYAGFRWSALYAFGGQPGGVGNGQTYAAAASYNHGPFGVGAGYFHANSNGTSGTFGGLNPDATSYAIDSVAINGAFVSANSIQIIRAAADYVISHFTVGVSYSNVEYSNYATAFGNQNNTKFNTGQVFLNYQITKAAIVGVGYNYTKGSGNGVTVSYNQFSFGADYFLSKRTDIYAVAGYQKASGNTISATTGQVVPAVASMGDFGIDASNNKQAMAVIGIRHTF
jgi:predicted porin